MTSLSQLLKDPPPACAFELSEAGIAFAKTGAPAQIEFQPLEEGALSVSPVHDNIQNPEVVAGHIRALAPANGARKRRAALILPDYAARLAVLDFDAFPADAAEQHALVRFRMKKSVPFDIGSAILSYFPQPRSTENGKIEVVAALMAMEIVRRYEEPFRACGFQPGYVTTSTLATLNLLEPDGLSLLVKLSGRTLMVIVLDGATLKLVRCVEMAESSPDEIESVMLPTLAYVEDELKATPKRILLCGLGSVGDSLARRWAVDWKVEAETLRSQYGAPGPANAGLLGYLESLRQ